METKEVIQDVSDLKKMWKPRVKMFDEWMDQLKLEDTLKKKNLETAVGNSPRTFYNLAHYLLSAGKTQHSIPLTADNPIEIQTVQV